MCLDTFSHLACWFEAVSSGLKTRKLSPFALMTSRMNALWTRVASAVDDPGEKLPGWGKTRAPRPLQTSDVRIVVEKSQRCGGIALAFEGGVTALGS
jgi:hypothetical protein